MYPHGSPPSIQVYEMNSVSPAHVDKATDPTRSEDSTAFNEERT